MKQAFVVKLGANTNSEVRHFEGCVEEVDTGRELRFRSTEELLAFLAECFDKAVRPPESEDDGCG